MDIHRAGKLTQAAFCRKHRISASLFTYWLSNSQPLQAPAKPLFREVPLPTPAAATATGPCVLTLPSGARIEFSVSQLREALALLVPNAVRDATC